MKSENGPSFCPANSAVDHFLLQNAGAFRRKALHDLPENGFDDTIFHSSSGKILGEWDHRLKGWGKKKHGTLSGD